MSPKIYLAFDVWQDQAQSPAQRADAGRLDDRRARPALTDPKRASERFFVPVVGHEGYGMGLMFGLLVRTLNGAVFGSDVVD